MSQQAGRFGEIAAPSLLSTNSTHERISTSYTGNPRNSAANNNADGVNPTFITRRSASRTNFGYLSAAEMDEVLSRFK